MQAALNSSRKSRVEEIVDDHDEGRVEKEGSLSINPDQND